MKKQLLLIIMLGISYTFFGQTISWYKTVKMETSAGVSNNIAYLNNHIFMVGNGQGFDGVVFNPSATSPDTLTELGTFIAQYNLDGSINWAKNIGSAGMEYKIVAKNGFLYISLYFSGDANFNSTDFPNFDASDTDFLLMKLDQNGDFIWVKHYGGLNLDRIFDIKVDNQDNILITGWFNKTLDIDTITLNTNSSSNFNAFIAKLDNDGNVIWANQFGGSGIDYGYGVATNSNNEVFMTGSYTTSVSDSTGTITSAGSADVFIAKYDADGNIMWKKTAGGVDDDAGKEIEIDNYGNIIVAGSFYQNADFETISAVSNYKTDVFTAKYNSDGDIDWVSTGGGDAYFVEEPNSIIIDSDNNIFISGIFGGSGNFGSFNMNVNGSGSQYFLLKYSATGTEMWLDGGLNTYYYSYGITIDESTGIYVTGRKGASGNTNNYDLFILKRIDNTTSSIDDTENASLLNLYPNPTTGTITIKGEGLEKVEIYNITGKLIKQIVVNSEQLSINLNKEKKGIYFVRITTEKRIITKKLILK